MIGAHEFLFKGLGSPPFFKIVYSWTREAVLAIAGNPTTMLIGSPNPDGKTLVHLLTEVLEGVEIHCY